MKKPQVLFVCVHNAGRSQMAAGFLSHFAGDRVRVLSAGSAPGPAVNPVAQEVMLEVGIDIGRAVPRKIRDDEVAHSDYVITMGCGDACPFFPGRMYLDWELKDPAGQPIGVVREIRDEIRGRVLDLCAELRIVEAEALSNQT